MEFSINGSACDRLPACSGVYRFYSAQQGLLYIGKSVDVHSRVLAHRANAKNNARQARIMRQVALVDCQPTAGEVGALLLENAAIKREQPLYNRRQRRQRRLYTLRLHPRADGYLQPKPLLFCPDGLRSEETFGLYHNPRHIETGIRKLAREHALCPQKLGLEAGSGPCFQHQIKRCSGACSGTESADAYNLKLHRALARQRLLAWPFAAPILLEEQANSPLPEQPTAQWLLIDHWAYLGTFDSAAQARAAAQDSSGRSFDRDAYHILLSALGAPETVVVDTDGLTLANPFAGTPVAA